MSVLHGIIKQCDNLLESSLVDGVDKLPVDEQSSVHGKLALVKGRVDFVRKD